MTDPKLELARTQATLARERLLSTAQELQYRLKPSTLADEAKQAVIRKGEEIADEASELVRTRPVAISATVAGIGALLGAGLFARRRIKDQD